MFPARIIHESWAVAFFPLLTCIPLNKLLSRRQIHAYARNVDVAHFASAGSRRGARRGRTESNNLRRLFVPPQQRQQQFQRVGRAGYFQLHPPLWYYRRHKRKLPYLSFLLTAV